MSETITIKKNTLIFLSITLLLVAIITISFNQNRTTVLSEDISPDTESLKTKFSILSSANTNSCGGTFNYVDSMPDDSRIQGSCCSSMDFHRYSEQIEGLKKYLEYKKIPPDPYDVKVSLAKELLSFQKEIILTLDQQSIYDEAVKLSHEGGPCCCKCWHWYAYEGLAKYLITEKEFTSEQIAEVWDLSDACGGSGHLEGVH